MQHASALQDHSLIVEKRRLRARSAFPSDNNAAIYHPYSHASPFPPQQKHEEFLHPAFDAWVVWERIGHTASMIRSSLTFSLPYALALHNLFTVSGKKCFILHLICKCGRCKKDKMHSKECSLSYVSLEDAKKLAKHS